MYAGMLAGKALAATQMGVHHKVCHILGGSFGLPHAETHTVVLPHATAYNAPFAVEAMDRLARALGAKNPVRALFELSGRLGAKRSLRDLGMPESGIERAANLAVEKPYWNPRPIELAAIRDLIARAWAGDPPLYN